MSLAPDDDPPFSGGANLHPLVSPGTPIGWRTFLDENDPERPGVVAGLGLPDVGVVVLAGPPKSLKTMLATQLGICISEGEGLPFLGYSTLPGLTVLVEEEGGRRQLRGRLRRQAEGLGASDPQFKLLLHTGVRLDTDAAVGALTRTLSPDVGALGLVILDPFGFLHGQDENKPSAMAPIMKRLNRLSLDLECLILLIHHVTKPQADRPAGRLGDRVRGAGAIAAGVDGLLLLDRTGDSRARLQGEFRDHEPIDIHLEFDPETLLLERTEIPKLTSKVDHEALRSFIGGSDRVTVQEVAVRFGTSKQTARAKLEELDDLDSYDGPRGTRFYTLRTGK